MKTTAPRPSSIPSSTFLNESKMLQQQNDAKQNVNSPNPNNPFKKPRSTNRAHIYFNDSGEMVSPSSKSNKKSTNTKEKESKTIVIFRCPLSEITNGAQKPRIFNLKSKNSTNNQNKKQIVEIQEEIILPPMLTNNPTNSSPSKKINNIEEKETLEHIKETTNVAEETNSPNEKSSDTSIATDNTTIAKNNTEETSNNLEITQNEDETNVSVANHEDDSKLQLTTANETSIMSVDCVDLSIDLDEDEKDNKIKNISTSSKSKRNITENHDLTKDDDEEDEDTSSSDVEEISEIIDLNETEDNCEESFNNSSFKDINVHKILPFSTDLTDIPAIGDIIVFKVNNLSLISN